jgi:hypothetical protein
VTGAGTVSIARLRGGRYLLIVGGTDANILDFYVSRRGAARLDPVSFVFAARWRESQLRTRLSGDREFGDYQNLSLITGGSGRLYLLGTHRSGDLFGADFADLFLLDNSGNTVAITKVGKRHLYCGVPFAGQQCNFDAGSCFCTGASTPTTARSPQ